MRRPANPPMSPGCSPATACSAEPAERSKVDVDPALSADRGRQKQRKAQHGGSLWGVEGLGPGPGMACPWSEAEARATWARAGP